MHLNLAIRAGGLEMTQFLISKGADIHHKINGGYNALMAGIFES
jgi:hypothetical protein